MNLYGLSGVARICADMDGAERYVTELFRVPPRGAPVRVRREGECWSVAAQEGVPLSLRYGYDLARLCREHGEPDYGSRSGDDYVINDETLLLRPEPLPRNAPIEVEFRLPPGAGVAVPWKKLGERRYLYDSELYDGGTYIALGRLSSLGTLRMANGDITITALDRARALNDAETREWLGKVSAPVVRFYGGLPGERVHLVLVPVPGSDDPGIFGSVLRRGIPSVVLYAGAEASLPALLSDWVAVHELFHTGNPKIKGGRLPWFIEGFTTYYQDVLRARSGLRSGTEMWGDLHDGFRRFCQPAGGRSLQTESRDLTRTRSYPRVYWGGACIAFITDVAIRRRSEGRSSLDDVLREMRGQGPFDEDEVIGRLERAAGAGLVRANLTARDRVPVMDLYPLLGIEPTGPDTVRLRDEAPLARIRRAIF